MKAKDLEVLNKIAESKDKNASDNFLQKVAELSNKEGFSLEALSASIEKEQLKISLDWINRTAVMIGSGNKECKKDDKVAFGLYLLAATKGNFYACRNVALRYQNGNGTDIDLAKAEEFCRKALAEPNCPEDKLNDRYKLLAEILFEQEKLVEAIERLNKISPNYKEINKVWELKLEIVQQALDKIFQDETQITSLQEASKNREVLVPKGEPAKDKFLTVQVDDKSRWPVINELFKGFTSEVLEYPKLAAIFSEEKRYKAIKEKLQSELGIIEEQLEKNLPAELKKSLTEQEKQIIAKIRQLTEYEKLMSVLKAKWEELTTVDGRRLRRIRNAEERFFNPSRLKEPKTKTVYDLAKDLLKKRFAESNEAVELLKVDNIPARQLITAERATLSAAASLSTVTLWRPNDNNKKYWTLGFLSGYNHFSNNEKVSIGDSEITYKHRTNPKNSRPGDAFSLDIGTYSEIIVIINKICNKDEAKEKALAKLMQQFAREGRAITCDDIEIIVSPPEDSDAEGSQVEDKNSSPYNKEFFKTKANQLNQICYLAFVIEPSEWFESSDRDKRYGWLTAQARAMRLLCEGYLSMKDVFGSDSPYGVFTGKKLADTDSTEDIKNKMLAISRLYEKFLEHKHSGDTMKFFRKHPNGVILPTMKEHRQELQYLYGGDSDTDGEGYESEGDVATFEIPSVIAP